MTERLDTNVFFDDVLAALDEHFSPFIAKGTPDRSYTLFHAVRAAHRIDLPSGGVVAFANHHEVRASITNVYECFEWAHQQHHDIPGVEAWGLAEGRRKDDFVELVATARTAPMRIDDRPLPVLRPDTKMLGYGKYRGAIMTVVTQIASHRSDVVVAVVDDLVATGVADSSDSDLLDRLEEMVDLQHPLDPDRRTEATTISKAAAKWLAGRSRNMGAFFGDVYDRVGGWASIDVDVGVALDALDAALKKSRHLGVDWADVRQTLTPTDTN